STITGNFSAKDTAATATYLNQAHRWNWGVTGGQIPYVSGGLQSFYDIQNGQPVLVEQNIIYRQTERSAAGLLAYPLSSARRLEFQSGVSHVSFDQVVRTQTFSVTGALLADQA